MDAPGLPVAVPPLEDVGVVPIVEPVVAAAPDVTAGETAGDGLPVALEAEPTPAWLPGFASLDFAVPGLGLMPGWVGASGLPDESERLPGLFTGFEPVGFEGSLILIGPP